VHPQLIAGNELNAAYAADGYGRIKGLSAIVTTFGITSSIDISLISPQELESFPH
jgi:hypothetical protein